MTHREPPNEAQPVVQRIRFRYTKTGRMRFASVRDFQRALERAVRRAGVPVAASGGFNPRPRISYANAAPTGAASAAEYVELGLRTPCDPEAIASSLTAVLPQGFAIVGAVAVDQGSLADRLEASEWLLDLRDVAPADVERAAAHVTGSDATVERMTKGGMRPIAVGEAWVAASVTPAPDGTELRVVTRHVVPTVRPEDIIGALLQHGGMAKPTSVLATRLAQGPLDSDGRVGDPLA